MRERAADHGKSTQKMSDFVAPWRNAHGFSHAMYIQHCKPDELKMCDPKLFKIIDKHGSAFDDEWWYWISKTGRYIRRCPVWMSKKRTDAEKPRKYDPSKKLTEFQSCGSR